MIRRADNDKYAIPGGQQEAGETLTQTAIRETKEETGFDVSVIDLIGLYSNPNHVIAYDDGEVRQEFSICFRAHLIGGSAKTSSESKEVVWVPENQIENLNIHPSIRLRLSHGIDRKGKVYYT
ncbi:NUDIX domain-containing protein [Lentzea albida]|uniref:NUDIX domain-containing protein n=2 Tax=Lentzea albida TaxID=65499 RepID=A0A1H9NT62_9PSEU|nr:NUDIX domain-containing protein [Lentzea albida]